MNSEQMRYARRGFERIFEDDGYTGDTLDRLVEKCMAHLVNVSTFQPSRPAAPVHPSIAMIERVWGCKVPDAIRESLIIDLGDATEEQLRSARVDWIKKNPRNRDAFTAVSWAKYSGKDNRKRQGAQAAQQEPAGFQGLHDWMAHHGQD